MGLYDRDYYRTPQRTGVGQVRMWSVTTWLIIINVAVFVIDRMIVRVEIHDYMLRHPGAILRDGHGPLELWGYFSIETAVVKAQAWRIFTCQFLHASVWHLLVNMFGLWLLGPVVEMRLGGRRYSFFYLLCGMAGPLMYIALWGLGILIHNRETELVGASAGIFGVLLAAAYLSPHQLIDLYFFELPLKYLAWIMMVVAAYTVLVHGNNAGGQAAHLGGGLLGWFLIRSEGVLDVVSPKKVVRGKKVKDWSRDMNR